MSCLIADGVWVGILLRRRPGAEMMLGGVGRAWPSLQEQVALASNPVSSEPESVTYHVARVSGSIDEAVTRQSTPQLCLAILEICEWKGANVVAHEERRLT